jgi:hypothetical protein
MGGETGGGLPGGGDNRSWLPRMAGGDRSSSINAPTIRIGGDKTGPAKINAGLLEVTGSGGEDVV